MNTILTRFSYVLSIKVREIHHSHDILLKFPPKFHHFTVLLKILLGKFDEKKNNSAIRILSNSNLSNVNVGKKFVKKSTQLF